MTTKSLLEMASLSGLSQSHISVSSFQVKSSVNDPCQEKRGSVRQGRGSEAGGERSSETQHRQAGARDPSADRPEPEAVPLFMQPYWSSPSTFGGCCH